MKKIIIFCLLVFLASSFVFAQDEKTGAITGMFGLGLGYSTIVETAPQFSFVFDLNLISKTGFSLSFTDVIGLRNSGGGGFTQNILFGAGYHYLRDKWNVGGAFLVSPTAMDIMFAGKINGSYYFGDIGITGVLLYRWTAGITWEMSMFDVFIGPSIRF